MTSLYKNHAACQKGRHFLAVARKIDSGLPVRVVALSLFQQLQMFRYKSDAM